MSYLGEEIGKLGFGLMRLPRTDAEHDVIDIEQTKKMVDAFLGAGFTYFDTAFVYTNSEDAIRQALVERHPRESYQIATKLAAWLGCKSREEAIAQFETSMARLNCGYIDFYLMHNLSAERAKVFERFGLWDWAQERKREGVIRHVGFSFHSTAEELDEILKAHPEAEFVQLQINYADWDSPSIQSRKCYETARRHGKPIIIMEPVKGGMLATPPESVAKILAGGEPKLSLAAWAMRYAASLDGLITVLSGASSLEQITDNINALKGFTRLDDAQRDVLERARAEMARLPIIPCTGCQYCAKVCPNDVAISACIDGLNYLNLYGNRALAKHQITIAGIHNKKPPTECVKCGECEGVCPQRINIIEHLEEAAKKLA